MALIIEDGSAVAGANSYITAAEYLDWSDARFDPARATAPADDAAAEKLILRAMDYFESLSFIGSKASSAQPLQWPRQNAYIDGYLVSSSSIPNEVKTSLYELTYAQETGSGEMNAIGRKTKREKVDVIEVEYADNSSSAVVNVAVSATLRKLLASGSGYGGFTVSRV